MIWSKVGKNKKTDFPKWLFCENFRSEDIEKMEKVAPKPSRYDQLMCTYQKL